MADERLDMKKAEKEIGERVTLLSGQNAAEAERFCVDLLAAAGRPEGRAESAALARCLCRFLLHKKTKSRFTDVMERNETLRRAVFGELNTNKYSLIFMMKRLLRLNDIELTRDILETLKNNPFRQEEAKPWSDRWSLAYLIDEALNAPADYLDLSEESLETIQIYSKEGWQRK